MDANPNNRPHPGPEPSDADVRAVASVLVRSVYQFLRRLPIEASLNFKIHLYKEHHPNQFGPLASSQTPNHGIEVVTRGILIVRAQRWLRDLPPDQLLRCTLKGYLDLFSERDQHFQAQIQALPQTSRQFLFPVHTQAPLPARVEALCQALATHQARIRAPLRGIFRTLSRYSLELLAYFLV